MIAWIKRHEALVWLIIFSLVLRLPSWWEPYWYGDEGIYLTLGQALRRGLVWYRDIHDNKPPALYLLAALSGTVVYFRLLLTAWFGATVAVFYRLCQKLLPKTPAAWTLATLTLIIVTTVFEGNIANAEIFIVLPVSLGMLLALKPKPNYPLVGFLFSLGFLFKVPAVFDLLALTFWLIGQKKIPLKQLLLLGLGFILPIGATIVYYWQMGAFEPYVRSALMQNIGYLNTWGGTSSGLLLRFGLAALLSLMAFRNLALIWFVWALFGALLSGRPYPHYLIQPVVPLALLMAAFIFKRRFRLITAAVFLLAGLAYYQVRFWQYPVLGYYQNFIAYAFGQKPQADYRRWFDRRVPQTYQLAEYIRTSTLPGEQIFIWGDEPYVYALSGRLPLGRYTVAYHVIDFDGFGATISSWDQKRPELVITLDYESRAFPQLEARLATDYVLAKTVAQARVYRRLNGLQP